ncbi:sugar phosphate nucleotidyltransferase [Bradyrhizobium zhanjiangense]|uniref:sugar phosphate nucleotidyltransferase n=1 Tax=Bradyrhizobium zhanjiangense TaxID=1325107 RepID=UPI0013E8D9AA|nr:sugar phosphate nucleotidyltransferase [Bradyrhizobium zhanjiangense]
MKAVILAGGLRTRISRKPTSVQPMIKIGDKPILWDILKIYSQHGINDFVICCGYKGYLIKVHRQLLSARTCQISLTKNRMEVHQRHAITGGRLKRIANYLTNDDVFLTYGDGVVDIDMAALVAFHHRLCSPL